jgi:DivIVA domain-containing protein
VPVVFEKLAAQLHEPSFRLAPSGYDQADVETFLDDVAARLEALEVRVARAERRADEAEATLVRVRRRVQDVPRSATDLADVIRAGERRADDLQDEAAREIERLRTDAAQHMQAVHREARMPELRERLATLRQETAAVESRRQSSAQSIDAAMTAVASSRHDLVDGIGAVLGELKEACP